MININYMAKMLFLLLSFLFIAGVIKVANAEVKTWCVAKPSASEAELNANIDFCCKNGVDCSVINPGGACFNPVARINQASVVMNSYYQKMGKNTWNCDFIKSGLISISDPSYGSCQYLYIGQCGE